jgi:c-di-GMP-binding flagellar brake protein YcgR
MATVRREISHDSRFIERKHPRFSLKLPIEYYPTKSKIGGTGHTANASEGGTTIYLRKHFKVGHLIKLRLFFSSSSGLNTIEIVSKIVWTENLETGEYRCGIKFVNISEEDISKWSSFLKNLSDLPH